ncbi:MAG: protein-L-isoaspartate(D-aspartate) O-methyltransferase [Planctomycetota bacterium]
MVAKQIAARGVRDPTVLAAMRAAPRHEFVPETLAPRAYQDRALPIGHDQTISQPYIVAVMTELLDLRAESRVLEVGTGSGYQAAVLAEIVACVHTIEIVEPLLRRAARTFERLAYRNVFLRFGDGGEGWPDAAPFDAILVAAAPEHVPGPLFDQLAVGGRLVVPVGKRDQELRVYSRGAGGFDERSVVNVRFVPLVGKYGT